MIKIILIINTISLILGLFILPSHSSKIDRKIIYKEICDTTQMMIHYKDCIKSTLDGTESKEMRKYYKEECKKEAKISYCKKVRGIQYSKKGEVIKFIPCDSVKKSIDIKLCEQ